MTHEQIEEVAQVAATLYGQVWATLPNWSKDIWRETVRNPSDSNTDMQRCALKAKAAWLEKQQAPQPEPEAEPEEVKPVERKSKSKK